MRSATPPRCFLTSPSDAVYSSIELIPLTFTAEIDAFSRSRLLSEAGLCDKSRLHSLNLPCADDFVNAPPSPSLNLDMDSRSYAVVMAYRLGLSLMSASECRALTCDQQQDALGDHAMHCHDDHGVKAARHDRTRGKSFQEAQSASLNPTKEMLGPIPGSQTRPADVFLENRVDGEKDCRKKSFRCERSLAFSIYTLSYIAPPKPLPPALKFLISRASEPPVLI